MCNLFFFECCADFFTILALPTVNGTTSVLLSKQKRQRSKGFLPFMSFSLRISSAEMGLHQFFLPKLGSLEHHRTRRGKRDQKAGHRVESRLQRVKSTSSATIWHGPMSRHHLCVLVTPILPPWHQCPPSPWGPIHVLILQSCLAWWIEGRQDSSLELLCASSLSSSCGRSPSLWA